MRGYEDSSQDLYDEDFPDQVEQKSTFRRRVIGILLISLGLVGTTVAANISLSNGRIEMGYNLDVLLNGSSSLDLYPSIADIKEHINSDSFDIEFKIDLRSSTTLTSRVRIDFSVEVSSE
jgi:hypothetical protein